MRTGKGKKRVKGNGKRQDKRQERQSEGREC